MTGFDVRIEADGTGCASFPTAVLPAISVALCEIRSALASPIELLGVRHLDPDGRDTAHPVTGGRTQIGFRVMGHPNWG